jgi:hypothetical protein
MVKATAGRRIDQIPEQRTGKHATEILQAYAAGATVASVKSTFNVSFETARALRDDAA